MSNFKCQLVELNLPHAAAMAIVSDQNSKRFNGSQMPIFDRFLINDSYMALKTPGARQDAAALMDYCLKYGKRLPSIFNQDANELQTNVSAQETVAERKKMIARQYAERGCDIISSIDFPEKSIDIQTKTEAEYYNYLASISERGHMPSPAIQNSDALPIAVHKLDPFGHNRMLQVRTLVFAEMRDRESGEIVRGISLELVDYFWERYPDYTETHTTYFKNEVTDFSYKYKKYTETQTSIGFSLGIGASAPNLNNQSNISADETVHSDGKPKNADEASGGEGDTWDEDETGNETGNETGDETGNETESSLHSRATPVSFGVNYSSKKVRLIEEEINEYKMTVGEEVGQRVQKIGKEPVW